MYKHGVYSELEKSALITTRSLGTIPAYIGTLPIHRANQKGAKEFDYSKYVNKPILIESYQDVAKLGLVTDDWAKYTLGEVINAHLLNGDKAVVPFILVNMVDPATKVSTGETTATITLSKEGSNLVGYLEATDAEIESLKVECPKMSTLTSGDDYTAVYEGDKIKITITKSVEEQANATVKYTAVETTISKVCTASKVQQALESLNNCEQTIGYIPTIIAMPGLSHKPDLHEKLIGYATNKVACKWYVTTVSDLDSTENTDVDTAITWKNKNGYNSKLDKVCFPMVMSGNKKYHLSTLAVVTMMNTDIANDNVPYVSPSNKVINANDTVLANGKPLYLNELEANKLNEKGITTTNIVKGALRLWGSHNSNYDFAKLDSIVAEERSDASVRMMFYLLNKLQYDYINEIDSPIARKDVDAILASVQQWLNSLVNEGKLLFAEVRFETTSNEFSEMIDGNFVFDVQTTLTPNAKSLTFKLAYTTDGLSVLVGGEE